MAMVRIDRVELPPAKPQRGAGAAGMMARVGPRPGARMTRGRGVRRAARLTIAGALAAAWMPAPSAAAPRSPSRPTIRTFGLQPREAEFIAALRPYAECLVAARSALLERFLTTTPAADEETRLQRRLDRENAACSPPPGRFRDGHLQLRGAVFEALLRNELAGAAPPASFASVPALSYMLPHPESDRMPRLMGAGLMAIYDCGARAAPLAVHRLLETAPGSGEEAAAFAAVAPALGACFPAGQSWELHPSAVRPFLAEVFYTLMKALRMQPEARR